MVEPAGIEPASRAIRSWFSTCVALIRDPPAKDKANLRRVEASMWVIVSHQESAEETEDGLSRWITPSMVTWNYHVGWRRDAMPANHSGSLSDLEFEVVIGNCQVGPLFKGGQTISLHATRSDKYPVETKAAPKCQRRDSSLPCVHYTISNVDRNPSSKISPQRCPESAPWKP